MWVTVLKGSVAGLGEKSQTEITTAAKKVCSDFKAAPTAEGTKAIEESVMSGLGLDDFNAKVFVSAAVAQYCADQTEAHMKATLGV